MLDVNICKKCIGEKEKRLKGKQINYQVSRKIKGKNVRINGWLKWMLHVKCHKNREIWIPQNTKDLSFCSYKLEHILKCQ